MRGWRQILSWEEFPESIGNVAYMWIDDPDFDSHDPNSQAQMRLLDPTAIRHALEQMEDNDVVIMTDHKDYDRDELRGKTVTVGDTEVTVQ